MEIISEIRGLTEKNGDEYVPLYERLASHDGVIKISEPEKAYSDRAADVRRRI